MGYVHRLSGEERTASGQNAAPSTFYKVYSVLAENQIYYLTYSAADAKSFSEFAHHFEYIVSSMPEGVKILFASFAHFKRLIWHPYNNPLQQKPTLPTNIQ